MAFVNKHTVLGCHKKNILIIVLDAGNFEIKVIMDSFPSKTSVTSLHFLTMFSHGPFFGVGIALSFPLPLIIPLIPS